MPLPVNVSMTLPRLAVHTLLAAAGDQAHRPCARRLSMQHSMEPEGHVPQRWHQLREGAAVGCLKDEHGEC